jgi:hypothetical protein
VLFSWGMRAPARVALPLVSLLVALLAPADAQEGFKITYDVDQSRPEKARLNGRIVNERSQDVFEVNVTAEALDSRGHVVARGISYIDARIARGDSRTFSVSVPTVPGTASFRVVVSSYRTGFSSQGP